MDYGEVLTGAWKIIWKFKVLWIFGILASCGTRVPNVNYQFSSADLSPQVQQAFGNGERFFNNYWWIIALFFMLLCVIIVIVIFLTTLGRIGLIKGALKADEGAEHVGFIELFNDSLPYFWRVFGLSFLSFVIFFFLFMLGGIAAIAAIGLTFGFALICLVPLCCLLFPLLIAVGVVLEQAYIAIVVEDRGVFDGLAHGWEVAKTHWEPILIMAVILIPGAFIVGLVIATPVIMISFPVYLSLMFTGGENIAPLVIGGICFLAYLPFLLILNGILRSYVQSAWTLTFLRVTGRGPNPDALSPLPDASLPPLQSMNA